MGLFGNKFDLKIVLTNSSKQIRTKVCDDTGKYSNEERDLWIYSDKDDIKGKVVITMKNQNSTLRHKGITIVVQGVLAYHYDSTLAPSFTSKYKLIKPPGDITSDIEIPFEFNDVSMPYDSYYGANTSIIYGATCIITKAMKNFTKSEPFFVQNYSLYPEISDSIKLIIGLQNCVQLQLEINKNNYHLNDVILGRLTFLQVKSPIVQARIQIEKVETTHRIFVTFNDYDEKQFTTIYDYEVLSGLPTVGLSIPFRIFLEYINLSPTMKMIESKLSTKFYIVINAYDISGRRYYKQEEIILWRKLEDPAKVQLQMVDSESLIQQLEIK